MLAEVAVSTLLGILSLPTSEISTKVTEQLATCAKQPTLVIETSTATPATARASHEKSQTWSPLCYWRVSVSAFEIQACGFGMLLPAWMF